MRRYTVFAGVNGAGKTSLYGNIISKEESDIGTRINIDEIVHGLGDWRDNRLQLEAGRQAVLLVRDYLAKGVSFHQETTLAGKSILRTMKDAKRSGYEVVMYYVGVNSPEIARARVHARVQRGGHGVTDADIERRYRTSLEHVKLAAPLCDAVRFYDNSGERLRFVLSIEHGVAMGRGVALPPWLAGLDVAPTCITRLS